LPKKILQNQEFGRRPGYTGGTKGRTLLEFHITLIGGCKMVYAPGKNIYTAYRNIRK
jgi:hypothetical protein